MFTNTKIRMVKVSDYERFIHAVIRRLQGKFDDSQILLLKTDFIKFESCQGHKFLFFDEFQQRYTCMCPHLI